MEKMIFLDFIVRLNAMRPYLPPIQFDQIADHPAAKALAALAEGQKIISDPPPAVEPQEQK